MKILKLITFLLLPYVALAQHKADTPRYLLPAFGSDTAHIAQTVAQKSALQLLWEEQTVSGQNAVVEKLTAGFFSTGKGAGAYAFHNTAARGTVLRVMNLNNGRIIYVKVLGPMPATKQFVGCALGLSDAAKTALAIHNSRAFCEIRYLGY